MDSSKKKLMENFFKKANIVVMVDKSPAIDISYKKGAIIIDVKDPLLLMGLGLDMNMFKKDDKNSVIRKAIKDMGFKIKLKYKFFEIEV